ncbi:MAG TPA: hypothetical protein VFP54_01680 [Acidimicrobiales bacterium]|nr:hypothetical protein [Acidimicrobiales bacterium]
MTQIRPTASLATGQEPLLASMVRQWAAERLPGRPPIAGRAAALAVARYEAGGTVAEACQEARAFVECVSRHPSSLGSTDRLMLSTAS